MSDDERIVYIVDDDPAIRDSIAFLVSSVGYRPIACASAREMLERLDDERPSCIVLDVRLPGLSGLELQREMVNRKIAAGIVFISGHGDIPKAVRAMRMGAIDFLEKPFDDQVLLDRIGDAFAASAARLVQRRKQAETERKLANLTEREREVIRLIVAGKTSKAIAADLEISVKTVENHRHNLMTKAKVGSAMQLIAWATGADGI
ncbi:MAG: response regulator transcription factor [Methylobacteriaceae bacterium]|nr:response regulator transcription factor [Methylobacteriaceae bacterium]